MDAEVDKENIVARAFDSYLTKEDIQGLVPDGVTDQDSMNIIRNYIDNWVKQQVVLHNAERNLDDESKNVEKQLQEYRSSLIMYAYERELVAQQLDTTVSMSEIEDFTVQTRITLS
jgi:retron-type reverse transcriptase